MIISAAKATAQPLSWVPPEVTAELMTEANYAHIDLDEVAAGDAGDFSSLLQSIQTKGSVQSQDVAVIRVAIRGKWYYPAEYLAKEKAAALGANFLILQSSFGGEQSAGSQRVYKAVRLQRYGGFPVYTLPRAAVETAQGAGNNQPTSSKMTVPSLKKPSFRKPPKPHAEFAWLWMDHGFILSHRLGVNLPSLTSAAWHDMELTVRTRFPKSEHAKLLKYFRDGSKIILDLQQKKLWPVL